MAKYPQKWSVLRENPPEYDESTGNYIPVPPTPQPWTGLLQQRFLDSKQTEITSNATSSELVLQLDPGLPGGLAHEDRVRFDGDIRVPAGESGTGLIRVGDVLVIQGDPHVRRPTMGGPAQYIVAIVRRATDMR